MLRDTNAQARVKALLALENSDPEALGMLRNALTDASIQVRLAAVNQLVKTCGAAAIDALAGALTDAEPEVQKASVRALGKIEGKEATQALIKALRVDDIAVQAEAEKVIDKVLDKEGVGVLIECLNHEDAWVRALIVRVLGNKKWKVNDPNDELVDRLFAIIRNGDLYLRNKAALTLAEMGQPIVPKLLEAKRDSDRKVQRAATLALEAIRSQEKKPLYDRVKEQRQSS